MGSNYAYPLERIAKSLEGIDHSLKLIVTPRKLDLRPASREIGKMMELIETHDSHDVTIESVDDISGQSTMYRAICKRCGAESSWFPNVGLAKSNLNRYACEVRR